MTFSCVGGKCKVVCSPPVVGTGGCTLIHLGSGGYSGNDGAGGTGGAFLGMGGSSSTGGAGGSVDVAGCDGSALDGVWLRSLDGLTMTLQADGCFIRGTADSPYNHHTVSGTYDPATRTMQGSINRTTVSSGCLTIMAVTLVLTDSTHFTLAITGTDGRCDLATTYNEATIWVRQ